MDIIAVTANSTLRSDGSLVMGAGCAADAAGKYPGLVEAAGRMVASTCGSFGFYGWRVFAHGSSRIGLLQTKRDWRKPSDIGLVMHSLQVLRAWCEQHPGITVAIAYPGIGHGGLLLIDVRKAIAMVGLPNTVTFYRRDQ
jgi:hypothetical protein